MGCGPGLYSWELGKLGHNVLGVDFNKAAYNYADKNKTIEDQVLYQNCDYIKNNISGKYNASIMIYCDFGALIPDEQISLLKKLKKLLDNNGVFIFDTFGISVMRDFAEERSWFISGGNDFWSSEPYFLMKEIKIYKEENTIGTRYYLIDQKTGKTKEFILWDQYYDEKSIGRLMSENGFEIIEINRDLVKYKEETLFVMAKSI